MHNEPEDARSLGIDWWSPNEWQEVPCEGVRDFASFLKQTKKKAVVLVQAVVGIVPLILKPSGKGVRPAAFSLLSNVLHGAMREHRVLDRDAGRVRLLNTAVPNPSSLRVALIRLCKDEIAQGIGREVVGIHCDIAKFYDSISL